MGVSESSIVLVPSANASQSICVQPQITTTHPDGSQETRNVGPPVCTDGGVSIIPVEGGEGPSSGSPTPGPPSGGSSSNPGDNNNEPVVRTRADCVGVVSIVRTRCLERFSQWKNTEIYACPNHSYSGFASLWSGIVLGVELGMSIEVNSQAECYEKVNSTTDVLLAACNRESAELEVELCNGLP